MLRGVFIKRVMDGVAYHGTVPDMGREKRVVNACTLSGAPTEMRKWSRASEEAASATQEQFVGIPVSQNIETIADERSSRIKFELLKLGPDVLARFERGLSPKASADWPLALETVSVNNEEDLLLPLYTIFRVFCTAAVQGSLSLRFRFVVFFCVESSSSPLAVSLSILLSYSLISL